MRRLYRVTCLGCSATFAAYTVERLGFKVRGHGCWRVDDAAAEL